MAAIVWPSSPSVGQNLSAAGVVFTWTGESWSVKSSTPSRILQLIGSSQDAGIAQPLVVANGLAECTVPKDLDGYSLYRVEAGLVLAQSTAGLPSFQITNVTQAVAMLSTVVSIDANEWASKDAATPAVINASNKLVHEGDILRLDQTVAGTGAKGIVVNLTFRP